MLSFRDFMVVDYKRARLNTSRGRHTNTRRGRIGEDTTDEALDFSQRRARARTMKKHKARIAIGRKKAMKRARRYEASSKTRKYARLAIFKKLGFKGADKSEMLQHSVKAVLKKD